MPARCRQCNTVIDDEKVREPCPTCGGTVRDFGFAPQCRQFGVTGHDATLTVKRLWTKLLQTADRLFAANEYGVAVVVAQTACEVIVERAMNQALAAVRANQKRKWWHFLLPWLGNTQDGE